MAFTQSSFTRKPLPDLVFRYRTGILAIIFLLLVGRVAISQDVQPPLVVEPGWSIEAVVAEPDLVTPTACCFDFDGRLFVIECHTHFPPEDYDGPSTDRILVFEDSDGDGRLDAKSVFYEGGKATMGLAIATDGSLLAVTRNEVTRHRDTDADGRCDRSDVLLSLETSANYPHNGLGGIAVDAAGDILIGLGENFGEPYKLIASDGSRQVGGGEGGGIFRMTPQGGDLMRVATGFWNPFGICVDPAGRMWTVGNDPDAMPPCRLIHVIEGGDYGFQFRFGRAGTHPLQAWNGELPGTLPFAAGTGEAPCAIAAIGNSLWVTSWGDNRIERYQLVERGSSWASETQTVVQGRPGFRPVGLAEAPDGSIYFTDWVSRSYSVHRKGRLWRLVPDQSRVVTNSSSFPSHSDREQTRMNLDVRSPVSGLIASLDASDPFAHQAAMVALAKSSRLGDLQLADAKTPRQAVGLLAAWRWRELSRDGSVTKEQRHDWIRRAIARKETSPRLLAVRWAAERGDRDLLPQIESMLDEADLPDALFRAVIAASSYLRDGTVRRGVRDPFQEQTLMRIAADRSRRGSVRALAIRMIPVEAAQPDAATLFDWMNHPSATDDVRREIVRLMIHRGGESDIASLTRIAMSGRFSGEIRADAVVGLPIGRLTDLAVDSDPAVSEEIRRRTASRNGVAASPPATDLDAWMELVGEGGDPAAGRRVFQRATCINCHAHQGRGATTGPDLTSLVGRDRVDILRSILQPSQDIGPLYVPWRILTVDGELLTGLKMPTPGVAEALDFQAADGTTFRVPLKDIETYSPATESIMPTGLQESITVGEMRDLLAFLLGAK